MSEKKKDGKQTCEKHCACHEIPNHHEHTESKEQEYLELAQRIKAEFENYFIKDAMTFYYLFTEVFLLVDNRAKNMFLTTFDGEHWFPIPYDMDTAIGRLLLPVKPFPLTSGVALAANGEA